MTKFKINKRTAAPYFSLINKTIILKEATHKNAPAAYTSQNPLAKPPNHKSPTLSTSCSKNSPNNKSATQR